MNSVEHDRLVKSALSLGYSKTVAETMASDILEKARKVRTAAGADKYGRPIGTTLGGGSGKPTMLSTSTGAGKGTDDGESARKKDEKRQRDIDRDRAADAEGERRTKERDEARKKIGAIAGARADLGRKVGGGNSTSEEKAIAGKIDNAIGIKGARVTVADGKYRARIFEVDDEGVEQDDLGPIVNVTAMSEKRLIQRVQSAWDNIDTNIDNGPAPKPQPATMPWDKKK